MRRRHQNRTGSGSALQQQGKSRRHQQRGLGARHLLRLLVLLAAQQGLTMVDGKILSRFVLQPAALLFVLSEAVAPRTALADTTGTVQGSPVEILQGPVTVNVGGTATFTVRWKHNWNGGTVTLASADDDIATVAPGTLTFPRKSSSRKRAAQTVTVTGAGAGNVNITLTMAALDRTRRHIVGTGSGNSVTETVSVTVNATPAGVTISDETLTINEGASDTYTVVLDTKPGGNVTVTPTSGDTGAATVSGALNFTTANWDTAQTVTVTGAADTDTTNESVTVSHGVTGYGAVTSGPDVTVTVTDTTVAAPVLTDATSTSPSGRIDFTWTHAGSSAGDYIRGATRFFLWESSHRLKGTSSWTINENGGPSIAGNTSQRTARAPLGTYYPDGVVVEVRIRAAGYNSGGGVVRGPWSNAREVTYKNDLLAALLFTAPSVQVGVNATQTYTVALTKAYGGTVSITSGDTGKATVSPPTLTFTAGNYNTAQTVTVTGVANGSTTIGHKFRLTGATADTIPNAVTVPVAVGTSELTGKIITLSAASTSITEGNSDKTDVTVTIKLGEAAPVGGLSPRFSIDADSTAKLNTNYTPSTTCTSPSPADADMCWGSNGPALPSAISAGSTTGTWTFSILGDTRDEGDETLKLRATAAGWTAGTLTITIVDDDGPGVTISKETLTVTEGASDTYTVVLDTNPGAQVVVTPTSTPVAKATVSGALTFTTATNNWSTAQTVTVTGVAAGTAIISHTVTGYSGVSNSDIEDVSVTVNAAVTIKPPEDLTIVPGPDRLYLSWTAPTDANRTGWRVQYRRREGVNWGEWSSWTAITDAAATNYDLTGLGRSYGYQVALAATGASNAASTAVTARGTTSEGVLEEESRELGVNEGGTASYKVKITSRPTGDVTITPSSANTDLSFDPTTLTFTTANWDTYQTLTVRAASDEDTNEETTRINYAASGGSYALTSEQGRKVRIRDTTPTLQLSTDPSAVTEGTPISLTVTSDKARTGTLPVTLTLEARDSSTFTAADIQGTLGPRNFNANFGDTAKTTGTVSIPTSTDADATEGPEAYRITLSDSTGYAVGSDTTADGTLNDGTAATVSVPATLPPVAEGVSSGKAVVTITTPRAFGASTTFNVSYGSTSSTADTDARGRGNPSGSNNGDYDNDAVTSVTFSATEKTKAIEIPIRDDDLDEEDETFTVTIAAAATLPDGFSLGNATTVVTITDDDSTPVLQSIEDVTLKQGQAVDITAAATDADGDTVTYTWSRKGGETSPAIPGGTGLAAARLNFTPPGTGTYTMTVTASDGTNEATEEVIITVSNANVVQVPERVPVDEGDGNAVVRITTAEAFGQAVTFNVTYGSTSSTSDNDATGAANPASGDYDNDAVTSVAFGASDTSKAIEIPVTDDDLDEENETFEVTIAAAATLPSGFQLARATTVVTINDDDTTPVLQPIEDVTLKQGQAVDITAAATDADGDTVTYTWSRKTSETSPAIPGGTSLTAARLNFTPPGTGTYTMTVTASDGANEATEEVVITVTTANVVQVPERVPVAEGAGNAVVPITTTEAFGQAVTFNVTYGSTSVATDNDATGAANPANGDYDNDVVTSVRFNSTETTKNIEIPISDDQAVEGEETFTVTIAAAATLPSGFQLARATTVVTITDNDTPGGGGGGGGSTPSSVPAAPTGVGGSAASTGNGQVTLTWANPGDSTIRKWQVQRREIGSPTGARLGLEAVSYRTGGQQAQPAQEGGSYGDWMDIPNSTASTTSHTVTGLTNGKTYGFRIRAVNTAGNGRPSAEIRVTLRQAPLKPTGVTATPGNGQVTLSWNNPDNATISKWQYQQKQADGSYGAWRDIPNSTATTTSHTVTGLTNGVAYSFRIRAVNAGGNGAPSDEVTVTPIDQDVVQADKARSQALAATSRTLLGMATDVLGSRSGGDAPVALAGAGGSMGEQAMGVVENLLGINGSELPTALTLEDVEDRLWSQSFQLTPPAKGSDGQQEWNPPSPQQRSWALWGAGELRSYRGNDDTEHLSYSGNMKTAWLGVDHQFTDRWMAGAALSFATGQSDYSYRKTDGSKDGGKMESRLTVVYPYGSFQASERLRLWGMAGMGWGSQHHRQTGDHTKTEGDLRLQMGVIGFEQALSPIGDLSLSLAGDAGLVKSTTDWKAGSGLDDLDVSLHRIRLGIDSSFPLTAHTTGYLNLKGRLDGGDLEMNAAEIVAGLHYGKERFSGFLQGRQTYAFDGSYAESALTAQLRLTANSDGTGLAWTLQPSYGASDGDLALAAGPSLWTDEQLESLTGSGSAQESREMALSSRVGYGIYLQSSDLLLTPFTEVRFREAGSQHIGLGLALEGNSWNVELSSSTENTANASPTTKTELNFSKKL